LGVTIPIASSIPMPDFVEKMFMEVFGNMGVWSVFTAVIMAPILEELIFRGVILDGLLKKYRVYYLPFYFIFLIMDWLQLRCFFLIKHQKK